jgi:hypothetical protein
LDCVDYIQSLITEYAEDPEQAEFINAYIEVYQAAAYLATVTISNTSSELEFYIEFCKATVDLSIALLNYYELGGAFGPFGGPVRR